VSDVCDEAFRNGLLLLGAGIYSNVIRVLVPLTITDAECDEALGVWESALERVLGAQAAVSRPHVVTDTAAD
jgi:4-aminobutyrate aminotransferase/(S)-3-amino-2-methylpropionate transaminase